MCNVYDKYLYIYVYNVIKMAFFTKDFEVLPLLSL